MTDKPKPKIEPKIARATLIWSGLSLSGICLLAGFTIWHLVRRGRLLRQSLGNPRKVVLPEVIPRKEA